MSRAMKQYRVVSKRVDCKLKYRRYDRRCDALRLLKLFGSEPWTAFGEEPDDYMCCPGSSCACNGITNRQNHTDRRAAMPDLEWVRLESREVGRWEEEPPA